MSGNSIHSHKQHYDDPKQPGWCAACRRAFPCPATLTGDEARTLAATPGKLAR